VRIFLVRHAEAAPGEPDALRPLTPAGQSAARELAAQLASEKLDAVLSSPLLRARQTADQIAHAADLTVEVDERLAPGATVDDVREAVSGRGETVVTVGHQPDCSEIYLDLTGEGRKFAPGAMAVVEL
jgi:phosphohistidine phosphatase